jgi:hypothetical protein
MCCGIHLEFHPCRIAGSFTENFTSNPFQLRQEPVTNTLNARRFQFFHSLRSLVPAFSLFHKFLADAQERRARAFSI